jgi:hypothetical protein
VSQLSVLVDKEKELLFIYGRDKVLKKGAPML